MNANVSVCAIGMRSNPISTRSTVYGRLVFRDIENAPSEIKRSVMNESIVPKIGVIN